MTVNLEQLRTYGVGFKAHFNRGLLTPNEQADEALLFATEIPSEGDSNEYGGLEPTGDMEEADHGPREVETLTAFNYSLKNKPYSKVVRVKEKHIQDDNVGIYGNKFLGLGLAGRRWKSKLAYEALRRGTELHCVDERPFFGTHEVAGETVSNHYVSGGGREPFYVLDVSKELKPIIVQIRKKPDFVAMDKPDDDYVFENGVYRYGSKARGAGGYSAWQYAARCDGELNATNINTIVAGMRSLRNDKGQRIGVHPKLLIIGPNNFARARELFKAERLANGASNTLFGSFQILEANYDIQ